MAYIDSPHILRPKNYSNNHKQCGYWIGDSDTEQELNINVCNSMGATRNSRIDREPRDKRSPKKYQRKFKIGDEVEYPKNILQSKEWSRGKIVELYKSNFKKYLVRDLKTYVVYTVHEKDLKLVSSPITNIENTIKDTVNKANEITSTADKILTTVEDLQNDLQLTGDNSFKENVCSSVTKQEISSNIIMNDQTGLSVIQDINYIENRVNKLEASVHKLKRNKQKEALQQYYTNIGLICTLL